MYGKKRLQGEPIRYFIRHNRVHETEEYDDKEDGITSEGIDSLGNTVLIKNLDMGKAKELMRVVLEGDYMESNKRKLILYLIGGLFTILLIISYFILFGGSDEKVPKNIDNLTNGILTPVSVDTSKIEVEESNDEKEIVERVDENIFEMQNIKLQNTRLSFQYEDLQKEYLKEIEKSKNLENINNAINQKNEQYAQNISELEKKIAILDIQLIKSENLVQKTDSERFICYLGAEVQKKCETAEREGKNNDCKDLYYNFLKNE